MFARFLTRRALQGNVKRIYKGDNLVIDVTDVLNGRCFLGSATIANLDTLHDCLTVGVGDVVKVDFLPEDDLIVSQITCYPGHTDPR